MARANAITSSRFLATIPQTLIAEPSIRAAMIGQTRSTKPMRYAPAADPFAGNRET
jgi:hypothetical protein